MIQQFLFKQKHSLHLTIRDWLVLSIGFSCLLVMARVIETGQKTYMFLVWNLFLAFVPYAISTWLSSRIRIMESKWKLAITLSVWLLFIPNSFYILTDLFHLSHYNGMPGWFDLLLVFSFAWNGIILGILSIRRVQVILSVVTRKVFSELAVFLFMWLNAFGVYLGRYSRYNSWDILQRPFSLASDMMDILCHPLQNKMEWGMITSYAAFMSLIYFTIVKVAESMNKQIINTK